LQTHTAAEIAFNRYISIFPKQSWEYVWARRPNESEKTVFLTGGRAVTFKSGQNYEDLRAETLDGCIIDECRQQHKNLWPMIIRPMLAKYKGWCDFYSTPNGYDWFYDLNDEMASNPGEWADFHSPSWEAFWWTPEEIESARRSMTEPQFAQEIGAEFRNITSGQAYFNFHDANRVLHNPFAKPGEAWSVHLPIAVAMDFNVNPMAWTLGQHRVNEFYWGAEINLPNSNTPQAAKVLADAVRGHAAGIEIIGDASGKSRGTRAAAGETDYDIISNELRRANIKFRINTPDSNPLVKDRVNIMNVTLKDGDGKPHQFINAKNCPNLIKDLERVTTVESTGIFALDKTSDKTLTHASDGVGYFVYVKSGNQFDIRPTTLKVLWR
jgi:hypothetical protein